jgi:hypothetical protein
MEPKLPSPNRGSEKLPGLYNQSIEHTVSVPAPEKTTEQRHERVEQRIDTSPAVAQPSILPPPVHMPPPIAVSDDDDAASSTSAPMIAADEDLIEKEWVDKAKTIIAQTKDDPYLREKEVGRLQADYLQKRYGKELGAS